MSKVEYMLVVAISAFVGMVVYLASDKLILLAFVAAAITAIVVLKFLEKTNVP
ncbi:MAG: hypothetical protein Q8P17_04770 [bacterium]|nr:hypothetical protein [bacterium]